MVNNKIWVDADACPRAIKEILYRAAQRTQILTTFVANVPLRLPKSPFLNSKIVDKGFDVADSVILSLINKGDLVITADIPLAAKIVEKEAFALNPRGEFYTNENIHQKLSTRNLMNELREMGENIGGPPPLSQKDRQSFANQLDRFLTKLQKSD